MDLAEIIEEKSFLGQEFLAWLWFKAEERGGAIELPGIGDIELAFEKHMLLEFGQGQASEKVICRGLQTELREARAGFGLGKKPAQARIRIAHNEHEFHVTLTAATLEFRNVRLPRSVSEREEKDDPDSLEGRILERIMLFEELAGLIDDLFRMFITVRTSDQWPGELLRIRAWAEEGLNQYLST